MTWQTRTAHGKTGEFVFHEGGPSDGELTLYLPAEVDSRPDAVASELASSRRVFSLVHAGFGPSKRPDWVDSIRDLADFDMELLDQVAPEGTLDIVGASLGGWIAAELALRLGRRVRRVVLVSPSGLLAANHLAADYWFAEQDERDAMLYLDPKSIPRVDLDEFLANEEATARYAWSPRFYEPTLGPRLSRLRSPTLVLWGAQDRFLPSPVADTWAAAVPQASVRIIDDCGHYPIYERPEEVSSLIAGWFAGTSKEVA